MRTDLITTTAVVLFAQERLDEGIPYGVILLVLVFAAFDPEEKLFLDSWRCLDSCLPRLVDSLPKEYILWCCIL